MTTFLCAEPPFDLAHDSEDSAFGSTSGKGAARKGFQEERGQPIRRCWTPLTPLGALLGATFCPPSLPHEGASPRPPAREPLVLVPDPLIRPVLAFPVSDSTEASPLGTQLHQLTSREAELDSIQDVSRRADPDRQAASRQACARSPRANGRAGGKGPPVSGQAGLPAASKKCSIYK